MTRRQGKNNLIRPLQIPLLTSLFAIATIGNQVIATPVASNITVHPIESLSNIERVVKGVVKDDSGETLPGVNIQIKGTNKGTTTDINGSYTITVDNDAAILVFSFVGFLSQEEAVGTRAQIDIALNNDNKALEEVIVTGFGTQKKESLTGAIAAVTSKDLAHVHGGSTVSTGLAGKIPGVTFRMADGRPGASAGLQIRNMGDPLYVIDGIQQDAGQFNNIAPNDIETITVLKDASAAIYGVRAANGVIVVTTKRGKLGSRNTVNIDAYTGWQNWTRYPQAVNDSYTWMLGKAEAEMNQYGRTTVTQSELDKYKQGTEYGYQSFNWRDFIIKKNAPMHNLNASVTGGSDKINYYMSVSRMYQNSVLGREFLFNRTNIQSNIDAQVSNRLKLGVQINGRIETRDQPGVPGVDDYWQPLFALMRNRPFERPYANDNPEYLNDIKHNETNWAYNNKKLGGYWTEHWRVLQSNFIGEYKIPGIEGLVAKGMYSYYIADRVMNGHEYTYEAYTYNPTDQSYTVTGGSTNPWRERGTRKIMRNVLQGHLNYNRTFNKHTIGSMFVVERQDVRTQDQWVHSVPSTNVLPLMYFTNMDTYNDSDDQEARIGYIGRFTYDYNSKYYFEASARRDASWKFHPDKRVGLFPSLSAGWRITEEQFFRNLIGSKSVLDDLKLRASWGVLGDDNNGVGPYDYLPGYNYNTGNVILSGNPYVTARDKGQVISNISWYKSKITDIGADFSLFNSKVTGSVDYFYRLRTGLRGRKYDILVPSELGYSLPDENVNSDAQFGWEGALYYNGRVNDFKYTIGGNISFTRSKFIESYRPIFNNSWDQYRNSNEGRLTGIAWGYQVAGRFESQEQINSYEVNVDGLGNSTLLPGDLIYKDLNSDGIINEYDTRPIGWSNFQPNLNFGINFSGQWKNFTFKADFSGGGMYSITQNHEQRWAYQNEGALNELFLDRWRRADPFDLNSAWIPGKYPALRFNNSGHSNNRDSDFWVHNARFIRARTLEVGYNLPTSLLNKVGVQRMRVYVNGYNLFSIDNVKKLNIDPEISNQAGLQYPQSKYVNVGVNLSL